MSIRALVLTGAVLFALPTQYALAQVEHSHHQEAGAPGDIGRVAFATSCNAKAQVEFEKGMALLHSFWYEEAAKEFNAASAADPACAMSHWGRAMSRFHQLWEFPDMSARRMALADLDSARKAGSPTPRERAYIDALSAYFGAKPTPPADTTTPDERMQSYRNAMRRLARAYPTDKIKSPVHLSIGQEAVSVGICSALRADDVVFGTYRGHALYLAKGGDLKQMVAELYGKDTGCARGKAPGTRY